jgi:hypothetical protein
MDELIEDTNTANGETGFAISKPSGNCGVLKKSIVEA